MKSTEQIDIPKFEATVSIPDGMTVEQVNAVAAAASAARSAQTESESK